MTALRESAIKELEKLPEDKISFILQIMQGVNALYNDGQSEGSVCKVVYINRIDNLSKG